MRLEDGDKTFDVIVNRGFKASYRHDDVSRDIRPFLDDERTRRPLIEALERGVSSHAHDVRRGAARTLREAGVEASALAVLLDDEGAEESQREKLLALTTDPNAQQGCNLLSCRKPSGTNTVGKRRMESDLGANQTGARRYAGSRSRFGSSWAEFRVAPIIREG